MGRFYIGKMMSLTLFTGLRKARQASQQSQTMAMKSFAVLLNLGTFWETPPSWSRLIIRKLQALWTSVVYRMSGKDFHKLSHTYPEMLHHVCVQLSRKLLKAEGRLTQIMFKKVDTRVREALAESANFTESTDSNKPVTIAVTHQHIANLIGASRQETSKALRRLADRAIIKLRYGSIVVTSPEKLCERVPEVLQEGNGC